MLCPTMIVRCMTTSSAFCSPVTDAVALGVTAAAIADTPSKKKKPKRTAVPSAKEDLGKKPADGCTSDASNDAAAESSP